MPQTSAFGAQAGDQPLSSLAIERRDPGPRDVSIEIRYCGVCHSDLHFARGEWGEQHWPIAPGHEIVGQVSAVGAEVEGFAVGDLVGVGRMVDSCRTCSACAEGLEQFCENGNTLTYGSVEKETGRTTQGGYSNEIVVDQDFCLHVSPDVDLAATAPLLCAGITTYSPLRRRNVGPDSRVGVVGLGSTRSEGAVSGGGLGSTLRADGPQAVAHGFGGSGYKPPRPPPDTASTIRRAVG